MTVELEALQVLLLSVIVLWVGDAITRRVAVLERFSIPVAVTGGILCSLLVAAADLLASVEVEFQLDTRDTLLLVFFSTIGLSAKFGQLKEGGRTLAILGGLTVAFLLLQNGVGVALATLSGKHWAYGLIGGSVSLAGGHGTAITWGNLAAQAGFEGAIALGLAFATFGLICGGLVGGPIANWLIRRHSLSPAADAVSAEHPENPSAGPGESGASPVFSVSSDQVIRTIFLLALCVGIGASLNEWLGAREIVLPGFLTAMGVGIVLTNLADVREQPVEPQVVHLFNDVSLHLFLAMSLMSMQLTELAGSFGAVAVVLAAQVALASAFAVFVVFRFCGRDYDAAVIAAGYSGLGLGATPVGVANMDAVTSRFGVSPKAFLVVPLIGAFLLDIINAFVIQAYIRFLGGS